MPSDALPKWERLLSSAARLQKILPSAVLVGGSAAALHVRHRFSSDADHVLTDLAQHFDETLAELESVAGCRAARVRRPVLILGSLDGIETGIRQLIRDQPLETVRMQCDLEETRLNEYKDLIPKWQDWSNVETVAMRIAELLLERL